MTPSYRGKKTAHVLYLVAVVLLLYRGPEIGSVKYADIAILIAFTVYLVHNFREIRLHSSITLLGAGFLLVSTLSIVLSPLPPLANSVLDIARYVLDFMLFTMTVHYLAQRDLSFHTIRGVYLLAATVSATLSITIFTLLFAGASEPWIANFAYRGGIQLRSMPFFYGPNHYASALSIGYVFALSYFHERLQARHKISIHQLFAASVFLLVIGGGIIATVSRTGLLVMAITTILVVGRELHSWCRRTVAFVLGSGLTIGGLVLLVFDIFTVLNNLVMSVRAGRLSGSLQKRWHLFYGAFVTWLEHPLFGVGPNNYIRYISELPATIRPEYAQYPHNTVIGLLSQHGLIGFLLAVGISIIVSRYVVWLTYTRERDLVPFYLIVTLAGLAVWSVFLDIFVARRLWFVFGLAVGIYYQRMG